MKEDSGRSERLMGIIYSLYGIDVTSRMRSRDEVDMRKIYCKILHEVGLTASHISRTIGFDHATVLHHNKKTEDLMVTDPMFMKRYREVYDAFKSFKPEFEKSDIESINKKLSIEQMASKVADYQQRIGAYIVAEEATSRKVDVLMNEINLLKQELSELRGENRELVPIMNLVRERTKRGQEPYVFRKLQAIYNGKIEA